MNGYLLDNNAVHKWFQGHPNVVVHVDAVPAGSPLLVSLIVLGEIECGHCRSAGTDPARRKEFEEWLAKTFLHPVLLSRHTTAIYGRIKADLFNRFAPKSALSEF